MGKMTYKVRKKSIEYDIGNTEIQSLGRQTTNESFGSLGNIRIHVSKWNKNVSKENQPSTGLKSDKKSFPQMLVSFFYRLIICSFF